MKEAEKIFELPKVCHTVKLTLTIMLQIIARHKYKHVTKGMPFGNVSGNSNFDRFDLKGQSLIL